MRDLLIGEPILYRAVDRPEIVEPEKPGLTQILGSNFSNF
jgi:hypothetical protein